MIEGYILSRKRMFSGIEIKSKTLPYALFFSINVEIYSNDYGSQMAKYTFESTDGKFKGKGGPLSMSGSGDSKLKKKVVRDLVFRLDDFVKQFKNL